MIIFSIGMPRAGSGWYFNLTNDLVIAAGFQDVRQVRKRYHLQRILTEVNCNIGALTTKRLLAVLAPSLLGNTFVVKAHAGPTPFALSLIRRGWLRPAYVYRDPRDAMLSAFENGQKARQKGQPNAFSSLVDFPASVAFIQEYVRISQAWMAVPQALHTRYENLLEQYDMEAGRLADFLELDVTDQGIKEVIERYKPEAAQGDQKGLHFSKGRTGRFREKYSLEEQAVLNEHIGNYLKAMGYMI